MTLPQDAIIRAFSDLLDELEQESTEGENKINQLIANPDYSYPGATGYAQAKLQMFGIKARAFRSSYLS